MNQGTLEVVKQEMARVNIDILGTSELKLTGMGEFNSDDHHIYYCGQESLRRNGVALRVTRRVRNAVLGCSLKNDRMISVHFQGKPFNITVIQVYSPTTNAKEAEVEHFCEDIQDLLELIYPCLYQGGEVLISCPGPELHVSLWGCSNTLGYPKDIPKYPFHHRGQKCKSRESRVTWINRQAWPQSTK